MTSGEPKTLADAIDAVEETYEFMLAYAAQGRAREEGGGDGIRDYLGRAEAGLAIIAAMAPLNGGGDDQGHSSRWFGRMRPAPAQPCVSYWGNAPSVRR